MNPVAHLALATVAFVGTHLLMSHPMRDGLVARLGERGFLVAYSVVSFITFGWLIWVARSFDDGQPLWIAPLWAWWPLSLLTLFASVLLVGSFAKNPALPHPGAQVGLAEREPAGVFAITRHPMNWGILLWALVHVLAYGGAINVVIATGMGLLALVGSLGQDAKKRRLLGEPWRAWERRTSFVPFGALLARRVGWRVATPSAVALLGGTALWAVAHWLHVRAAGPFAYIPIG